MKQVKPEPQKNAVTEGVAISEGDVIRVDTSLVSTDLLVLDEKGNAVSGLTAADFLIRENGLPQNISHFLLGDNVNVPRMIVLIIDYSCGSMSGLENSFTGAKTLVDKLGPKDQMAIVTDDVEMIQDFTSDKGKLKKKLRDLYHRTNMDREFFDRPGPGRFGLSKQYSALMATLKEAFTVEDIRPIVIFQTDGDEAYLLRDPVVKPTIPDGLPADLIGMAERSVDSIRKERLENPAQFSLDDVYRTVEKSRVTIYTVNPGPQYVGLKPDVQMAKKLADRQKMFGKVVKYTTGPELSHVRDMYFNSVQMRWEIDEAAKLQSTLLEVAPLTGGWTAFLENPEQADAIYSRIFTDINQRYIVGYYPTNKTRDGKRRTIQFAVKGHPEYQVHGRSSYFAPGP